MKVSHYLLQRFWSRSLCKRVACTVSVRILSCVLLFGTTACNMFVQSIQPPDNVVQDRALDTERYLPQLMNGVRYDFGVAYNRISLAGSLIADEIESRDFSTGYDAEVGNYLFDFDEGKRSDFEFYGAGAYFMLLTQSRFTADTLITRVKTRIPFGTSAASQTLRNSALFVGFFYGAASRYLFATYFALEPTRGGSVIEPYGRFLPSSEIYAQALPLLDSARRYATPSEQRMSFTLSARIALFADQYGDTERFAQSGLQQGSAPLTFPYYRIDGVSNFSTNNFNIWAHRYFQQYRVWQALVWVAKRFQDYVAQDTAERVRIPLTTVQYLTNTILVQRKYTAEDSPMNFLTWQENELMLAECKIRRGAAAEALAHINRVRTSYNLRPLTEATLETIYTERDKELFCTGLRLPDQRRFNRWHLGTGTWQYLPIPQSERDLNPNLKP